ncbi:MAG TPA: glycosyltransferase family 87 protein, partial [Puia sp.]
MPNRRSPLLYLLPLMLLLGVCVKRAVSVPFSDYAGYYSGSRELLRGHPLDAYNMLQLNLTIEAQGYKDVFVSYAPFPPFTSLVLAPFLLLPMGLSKILFNCCSCALFLFTLYRSSRFLAVPPWLLLLLPLVFLFPLVNNVFFGQSYLLLSCLLLEGYMAYREERIVASSLLWGIAILFKLFPGVLFVFLLLRKKYKQALYLSVACGLLFLLSLSINGVTVWKYYLSEVVPKLNNGELNDSFTYVFQSAFMLFKRVFLFDALLNPHPLVSNNPYAFAATMAVFKAVILSSAILLTIWKKADDFFSFAVWLAASMLISPNGSSYSLVLLVIPVLALAAKNQSVSTKYPFVLLLSLLVLVATCNISVQRFGAYPVFGQFPRLYGLLIFFGLLLWKGMRGERRIKTPFAILALCLTLLLFTLDIRKYLPGKDPDP